MQKVEISELCRHAQFSEDDFVFYDRFVQICSERNISPSKAAVEAGLSKSTVTKWKTTPTAEPTGTALKKLSEYFGISISEFLGEEKTPTRLGERQISDNELKFALWGDCDDIDEDDLADVRSYAAFVRERKKRK